MSNQNFEQLLFQLGQATLEIADKMDSMADKMDSMAGKLDGMAGKLDHVAEKMDSVAEKMDSMAGRMDQLTGKLDRLADLVTEGFQDLKTEIRHQAETARVQADSVSRLITLIERQNNLGNPE